MRPDIKKKIEELAWPNWIDLSIITWTTETEWLDIPMEMPEISVWTIYDEIKDKVIILSSDEIIDLMHRILMDRAWAMSEEEDDED